MAPLILQVGMGMGMVVSMDMEGSERKGGQSSLQHIPQE